MRTVCLHTQECRKHSHARVVPVRTVPGKRKAQARCSTHAPGINSSTHFLPRALGRWCGPGPSSTACPCLRNPAAPACGPLLVVVELLLAALWREWALTHWHHWCCSGHGCLSGCASKVRGCSHRWMRTGWTGCGAYWTVASPPLHCCPSPLPCPLMRRPRCVRLRCCGLGVV